MTLPWGELALFMIAIAMLALYGLTIKWALPDRISRPKTQDW